MTASDSYSPSVLERAEGGYAMVALDQRESMRDLLVTSDRSDEAMRSFKATAASELSAYASAILLDRVYGIDQRPPAWASTTPLILAADVFDQPAGQPVATSTLDTSVTPDYVRAAGASALKFLALWRSGDDISERADLVASFIRLAHDAGVPAVVEGIVRADSGTWAGMEERDDAIVACAAELAGLGADLYKAEVPGTTAELSSVESGSRRISDVVNCLWVVLSNGVPPTDFPDAVEAACAGGASGFLAGRAIWTAAAAAGDTAAALRNDAVGRFLAISKRVPRTAVVA